MFTGSTLPLKSFSDRFGLAVIRDAEFAFIGKVPTRLDKRIVPCAKAAHVRDAIARPDISGIITTEELSPLVPEHLGLAVAGNPASAAMLLHEAVLAMPNFQWSSFQSRIHPRATIYPGAYIAPNDVEIAEDVVIYPNAVIFPRTVIGARSSIGAGTVVGTDAFEVNMDAEPRTVLKQGGGVRIGTDVDVQAKCTIVRATFGGFTEIGDESKLDCHIHLAHDCLVGRRVRIAACAEISGRVTIEDDCFIGPNASITNGCTIGPRAHVTIGSVVTRDVAEDGHVTGNFAVEHKKWLYFMRNFK